MKDFARTLIALDLSPMDRKIMDMLQLVKPILDIRKAYFLHIMPDFTLPKDVDVEFQKLFAPEYPTDEKVKDKIALDVAEALGNWPGLETSVEVREGKPYQKLLHWTEVKEIDLLLLGHKQESEGSGIAAKRVARNSKCNVLFVPDQFEGPIQKILVPIDFSDNSARALKTALAFQKQLDNVEIHCLYIIDLPPTDYYMRPTVNSGFFKVLQESATKAYEEFVERHQFDTANLKANFVENVYNNITTHISTFAENHQIDMIIMGAKGHSAIESFVFGSVTERLVNRNKINPIMIVR